jgi:hypothetical protein
LDDDDDDDDADVDIKRVWENIKENMKASPTVSLGYDELKRHKPRFDEECSELLEQRIQTKLQRLQNQAKQIEIIQTM